MDSEEPDVFAAVVPAHGTSPAFAAAHIRLNGTPISGTDTKIIGRYIRHDSREFMADHPRVSVDRLAPCKCVKVAPTYTYLLHPNQSVPFGTLAWELPVPQIFPALPAQFASFVLSS